MGICEVVYKGRRKLTTKNADYSNGHCYNGWGVIHIDYSIEMEK